MKYERSVNGQRGSVSFLCFIPTGFTLTIQSKIEQSKHKQKYQDLTIPVLLLFVFRFFTPRSIYLKVTLCHLLSKWKKGKKGMRMKAKSAHKQRIYKENSNLRPKQIKLNLSLFLTLL